MTNAMQGTSPIAPSQTGVIPVPPSVPATPMSAQSSLPTVSLPSGPGEKPAGSESLRQPEIQDIMEVSDSGKVEPAKDPMAPIVPSGATVPSSIPAAMARPMTPPSMIPPVMSSGLPQSAPIIPDPKPSLDVVAPVTMPASASTTAPTTPTLSTTPSPVVPPKPDKVSTVNEPLVPPAPSTANLVSPVVGAVPTVTVNAAGSDNKGDASKKSGSKLKFIAPLLLLFFLVFGGGIAFFLSQRQQSYQNQASALTSKGSVDTYSCSQVKGWACDSSNYALPLKIALYYDEFKQSNLILVQDANVNRADVSDSCGGTTNHGFLIDIPADKVPAGQHTLIVKGIPVGAGNQLNTADMFTIPMPPGASSIISCGNTSQTCSAVFTAAAAPVNSIACSKESYNDLLTNVAGQYSYTTRTTNFNPGDVVVFKITMKNTGEEVQQFSLKDILIGNELDRLTFMDTSCGTYNDASKTITASTNPVTAGNEVVCGFRARINNSINAPLVITNTATITAGSLTASCDAPLNVVIPGSSPSPSPSVSPSPSPTPSPSPLVCGSTCGTGSVCPNDHTCNNGKCQLNACVSGASCSDDMCRVTACGSSCSTSTDCPNDHTCNGGVCKLTTCVNGTSTCASDSCSVVKASPSPSPTPLVCGSTCGTGSVCPNDHTCNNGKCQLNTCVSGASCSDDMCRATSCGSSCSTNTDCPNDHTCNAGVCRLTTCVNGTSTCASDSCSVVKVVTVYPTPTTITQYQTQTVVQNVVKNVVPNVVQPSPTVGCNVACNTNADCTNGNHICVDTATGRRCRLDSNVASETCSAVGKTVIASPKPVKLPVAGSNDVLKALGVGAVSVVLGIVGLLLL